MATIKRLVLKNFKRFKSIELEFDPELTILVGGNEAGKSSVLQALDIVLSVSRSKVEALGLDTIFNAKCIAEFLGGERKIADLPELLVEVYFDGIEGHHDLDGRNNSKGADHLGIKMVCKPVDEYTKEIQTILAEKHESFPFEYYGIHFLTFTDEDDPAAVLALYKDPQTVKLFYKEHHKYACYSQNWGASKGVDRYQDVCVVLNPVNAKAWQNGSFRNINTETRNKLYVACSRARGNLTFVPESLLKSYKLS